MLKAGKLLLIGRGERHEVRNTGVSMLQTLNVYSPRACDAGGEPLGPGCG